MKKTLFGLLTCLILVVGFSSLSWGLTPNLMPINTAVGLDPSSNQVTCASTNTTLKPATTYASTAQNGRLSVMFTRLDSGTNTVLLKPKGKVDTATITTGNAALGLFFKGDRLWFDRIGGVEWECITDTGTATIGVFEEK